MPKPSALFIVLQVFDYFVGDVCIKVNGMLLKLLLAPQNPEMCVRQRQTAISFVITVMQPLQPARHVALCLGHV